MTTDRLAARATEARRVLRYQLSGLGKHTVTMPVGAEIVHVATQGYRPTMWAEVPDWEARGIENPNSIPRVFHVVNTGEEIEANWHAIYVGTVHIEWSAWHIYEGVR